MDCILGLKLCLYGNHTLFDLYPTLSLPKGSLYPSTSTPEPLFRTPDHSSCLRLCSLQYLHPMSPLRIDTHGYPTSYQVDGTPSKFPALIWTFHMLIQKSFGRSTRVVCLQSLQTLFGPYWTLSEIKGTVLRWETQRMSWGQSPSESVILTPPRDCMHPCAQYLTIRFFWICCTGPWNIWYDSLMKLVWGYWFRFCLKGRRWQKLLTYYHIL